MINGMLARKVGMTQIFEDDGTVVPVTVLQAGPVTVIQKKTVEKDGVDQVQVGFEPIPERKVNLPMRGHFKDQQPTRTLRDFKVEDISAVEVGQTFDATIFSAGEKISVSGTSKGRGFSGVIKRHGFSGFPASHGHRENKRSTGSIGQGTDPGRVFKGKKMAGQYGNTTVTQMCLTIARVLADENAVLVRGAVPGPNGRLVTILKR